MKRHITITVWFSALILSGCITDYEVKGIKGLNTILVVDGFITDDESVITLNSSVDLMNDDPVSSTCIDDADVSVECDDGTIFKAKAPELESGSRNGRYVIRTGKLNPECKYRLKIEIDENGSRSEYCSGFSYPIETPEIDSVFWTKEDNGLPVRIHVATHAPDHTVMYYRWSYREDWEIVSEAFLEPYPEYCWNEDKNREVLVASAEKTVSGRTIEVITEISPHNRKLERLYRITVNQNAISKKAYDYYANIIKNADRTGSIFAPIPSELRGNIACTTDPKNPVIGYVDVSTTTRNHLYISYWDGAFEYRVSECEVIAFKVNSETGVVIPDEFVDFYVVYKIEYIIGTKIPTDFEIILESCVDCTYFGTTRKPENWPNDH